MLSKEAARLRLEAGLPGGEFEAASPALAGPAPGIADNWAKLPEAATKESRRLERNKERLKRNFSL